MNNKVRNITYDPTHWQLVPKDLWTGMLNSMILAADVQVEVSNDGGRISATITDTTAERMWTAALLAAPSFSWHEQTITPNDAIARANKLLADLSVLRGQLEQAITEIHTAGDILETVIYDDKSQ